MTRVREAPLVGHDLARLRVREPYLLRCFEQRRLALPGRLQERRIGGANPQRLGRKGEQARKARIPLHERSLGIEHRETLAQAVQRGLQPQGEAALLGFDASRPRPFLVEKPSRPQKPHHRQHRAQTREDAHPNAAPLADREMAGEPPVLVRRHGPEQALDALRQRPPVIGLYEAEGVGRLAALPQRHRLAQLVELAPDERLEGVEPILGDRIVPRQLLQAALQARQPGQRRRVRGEVVLVARQKKAALAGLRVPHREVQVLDGGDDLVAMADLVARVAGGTEPLPGQPADERQHRDQNREHEGVGAKDEGWQHDPAGEGVGDGRLLTLGVPHIGAGVKRGCRRDDDDIPRRCDTMPAHRPAGVARATQGQGPSAPLTSG